jgi:hypothetical protein
MKKLVLSQALSWVPFRFHSTKRRDPQVLPTRIFDR